MSDKEASTFRLRYAVRAEISASPGKVWGKLTDAGGFAAWNSTVDRIEGEIALGKRLTITVPIAPGRKFTPTVKELITEQKMVWQDGFYPMFQGTRTFTLTPQGRRHDVRDGGAVSRHHAADDQGLPARFRPGVRSLCRRSQEGLRSGVTLARREACRD
jgi:uncharacterized protein YndB with AHSA1/START domain